MEKSKRLIQVLVVLVMLFGVMGGIPQAQAQTTEAVVVVRDLTYWDATYTGYVAATRFEKWPITFTATENFTVTATPITEGFTPLVILFSESGTELARASGVLTSEQPAGNYYVQVEPETGEGFYNLSIRRVEITPPPSTDPAADVAAETASLKVGDTTLISVSLSNVPATGYTSAEFTCTYDPAFVTVGDITVAGLFGADPAVAFNESMGSFIVAIAGSNGDMATADGVAFTFSATALQVGQTDVVCLARVSQGDNLLTDIASTGATLTITEDVVVVEEGTLTGQVLAGKPVMVSLYDATDTLVAVAAAAADGTFSLNAPAGTYTVVAEAAGYLSAEGEAILAANETTTKATVTLLAGDIDGNAVIDQFDAMTIGMSYNTADPAAADLNNDGVINVLDLELLAANYRQAGPIVW